MPITRWNYVFTGLNFILGGFALVSILFYSFSYFSILFAFMLLIFWFFNKSKSSNLYKKATKNGWIESELAIYCSFAIWTSVYVSASQIGSKHPILETIFSFIAVTGGLGLVFSVFPLTHLFEKIENRIK